MCTEVVQLYSIPSDVLYLHYSVQRLLLYTVVQSCMHQLSVPENFDILIHFRY